MTPAHEIVRTNEPAPYALRRMSATAIATANTPAFREWASRLATRAPPRDYVEQLKQLYDGILKRWRYVMERDEWIHGTPESLIGTVLGLKYNTDTQPALADIDRAPSAEKGFGDCDDVATVVAAGVMALGMKAAFAVGVFRGGAHVWVLATTPRGENIHIDPVGHPEHEFGWHLPGQVHVIPIHGKTSDKPMGRTYFGNVEQGLQSQTRVPHWCMVHPGDCGGGRVLSVPKRNAKMFEAGLAVDGTPAIDQFGHMYEYDGHNDLWRNVQVGDMGRIGRRGRSRRRKRRTARRKAIRRVSRAVARKVQPIARSVAGRVMSSRAGQQAVGAALQSVGIPRRLTVGVMAAAANLIKKIGILKFARLIRTDRKRAAQLAAQAAKAGLRRAMPGGMLSGHDSEPDGHVVQQSGVAFAAQPVDAIIGIPGMYAFGALEVATTPTPGQWYRIQKGDTLFGVTSKAFGVKAGGTRLKLSRTINDAVANQVYFDSSLADNMFKDGRISFKPRYSDDPEGAISGDSGSSYALIWIPETAGDEPPAIEEEEAIVEPIPLPEPEPVPPAVVPEPPIEPEPEPMPPIDIVVPPEPEPEPEPVPLPPTEVIPAPVVPDEPEPPVTPPVEPIVGPVPGYNVPAVTPPPPYRPVPTPPAAEDCPPGYEPDPTGAGDCRLLPGTPSIVDEIPTPMPMPPPGWQPTRPDDYPSAPPFAPAPAPTPYDPNYPQQQASQQAPPIGIGLALLLLDMLG